ncbi:MULTISPECIES: CPBP family intramembrane glutamic endopeptidase [Sphingobacterium]|uniref:CPBP family intramembrane glutamic endopeptidase n=1 Tax=Sphingobacterium TaxID=28453 RepID=UPI00097E8625|nr:CPBP family intramembrane glutamic endopeptidase [Sphingobacterium faecium]PTX11875.1 CAAX prenyl protease-like protein [Sphingobacterium faecium]WGQ13824.1 CPBP family intramembrane metalloprotease [Sphingobacterium faecium]SJN45834.1 putative metal-dependent membrane protease [Sphingobacterium faecium PCAi_F2.5]
MYSKIDLKYHYFKENVKNFFFGSVLSAVVLTIFFEIFSTFRIFNDVAILPQVNLLFVCLFGAIFEELFFSYFLFRFFSRYFKLGLSIFITSIIFATLHLGNDHATYLSFISHLIGSWVYIFAFIKSKNIFLCIGLHFGWNYLQILYSQPMSGVVKQSFFYVSLPENPFLFGADYGLEAGLYSFILRFILISLIFFYYQYRQRESSRLH